MSIENLSTRELDVFNELSAIYEDLAYGQYGLTLINQYAHAVQAGMHAKRRGLPATLTVAALLHDLGHMLYSLGEHPAAQGVDDRHEEIGAEWLGLHFGPGVVEPVRLHVAAKRYLCALDPTYFARLSPDSVESLALQGGAMCEQEVIAFQALPYWQEAVALRQIDEAAKDPHAPLPAFSSFRDEIVSALRFGKRALG